MGKRRLKVMFVTPCFEEGGGERRLVNLFRHLDRNLFTLVLVCWKVHTSHFLNMIPDHVIIYDLKRTRRFRYELLRIIGEMTHLIRVEKPDIVMSFLNEWHIALFLALKLSRRHRPKVILNEIGWISGWLNVIQNDEPIRAGLVRWLYKHVYLRAADLVVCASRNVKDDLICNFKADPSKVITIHNLIDIAEVKKLAKESVDHPWFQDTTPLIVSIGRFSAQKGYRYLIEAFREVISNTTAKLLIVGDGPERPKLEAMICAYGLRDYIEILGYQRNPFKYLREASVFVLPSLTEGFGCVVVEALAVGIPVVATECAGPAEILGNGEGGILVPIKDTRAMAKAILTILCNEQLRRELSKKAKKRAQDFSISRIIPKYEEVFLRHAY